MSKSKRELALDKLHEALNDYLTIIGWAVLSSGPVAIVHWPEEPALVRQLTIKFIGGPLKGRVRKPKGGGRK